MGVHRCRTLFKQHELQHYKPDEFDALPFSETFTFIYTLCNTFETQALHSDQYETLKASMAGLEAIA